MATTEAQQHSRNLVIDKTSQDRADGDAYANQGGGKLGSGNDNSGHPANDVLAPRERHDANPEPAQADNAAAAAAATAAANRAAGQGERGTRGSGTQVLSGAGQLADDRPGRNAPKGS